MFPRILICGSRDWTDRTFFFEAMYRWIDKHGASHTLLDATGTAPLDFQVEHMLYHQPSNSLIAIRGLSRRGTTWHSRY